MPATPAPIGMTTADWALIVSLLSFAVSLASFVWNIWSKWIYPKARLRVGIAVMFLISEDGKFPPSIGVNATNFGPSDTTIKNLIARSRAKGWWYKWGADRWRWGILMSVRTPQEAIEPQGPSINGLPTKIAVGQEYSTYLVFRHQHMRDDKHVDVGFVDIFGRHHWAPRKSVQKVIKSIQNEWPQEA